MTGINRPLAFEPLTEEVGLEIVDRVEQKRCLCRTDVPVTPRETDGAQFRYPVDKAVQISASELAMPNVAGMLIRDESGEIVSDIQQLETAELPHGNYSIELLTQFKTYLSVSSELEVVADATEFHIDFGSQTEIAMGALSSHERPAYRVQTTSDPVDMMRVVETFSSALKTATPDRAFPTLRGHPPGVDLGDSLDIPESIQRPDTGVRLEIPARRDAVYVASPLTYYLGADLHPGPTPRLVTEDGFEYSLAQQGGFEATVERTLKQLFFLDCLTRTEGLYQIDLHERNEVEPLLDLDFAAVYEKPVHEQVATYLDVPFEVIEDFIPDWRLTAHVQPDADTIETLPFVVDDLAIVRTDTANTAGGQPPTEVPAGADRDTRFTRAASDESTTTDMEYVEPKQTDSLEQAWIGDDIPIGASKLTKSAFENRLDRTPVDGEISISIVLNDPRMDEERNLADRAYGNRESLPFDVEVRQDVTTAELEILLRQDTHFLHYIGHTERDGFECPDGKLDVRTVEETGVQAFLLNACNSYEQGLGLIEAGAVGGIVTLSDVINDGAVRIGETVARLLNSGFPLRAALTIARDESILGGQYIVVGDGGMSVAQPASGTPNLGELSKNGDEYSLGLRTYPTDFAGLGAVYHPNISQNQTYFLSSGKIGEFTLSESELINFLSLENIPVRFDGDLGWSHSMCLGI